MNEATFAVFDYCQEVLTEHYGPRIQWGGREVDQYGGGLEAVLDGHSIVIVVRRHEDTIHLKPHYIEISLDHPTQLLNAIEQELTALRTFKSCKLKLSEYYGDRLQWSQWSQSIFIELDSYSFYLQYIEPGVFRHQFRIANGWAHQEFDSPDEVIDAMEFVYQQTKAGEDASQ